MIWTTEELLLGLIVLETFFHIFGCIQRAEIIKHGQKNHS